MRRTTKILFFLFLILLFLGGFFGFGKKCWAIPAGDVVINEVMWMGSSDSGNSADDGPNDQWIELKNVSGKDLNFKNWYLKYNKSSTGNENKFATIGNDNIVKDGGYFLLSHYIEHNSAISVERDNTMDNFDFGKFQVLLYDDKNNLIDTAGNKSGEPEKGDKTNFYSMERNDILGDGSDYANWHTCSDFNSSASYWDNGRTECGTPTPLPSENNETTTLDKVSLYAGKIKINEVYPSPNTKLGEKEFVEIINNSEETNLDFSQWCIKDKVQHENGAKGVCGDVFDKIENGKFIVFSGSFSLNNDSGGDTVFLYDENKNLVDSISYENGKAEYSYAFNSSAWQWTSRETKGAENQFDELLSGQIKKDKTIYAGIYANFEVKTDAKAEHFTWNFGDGHKSYLKKTRHKYEDSGIYLASLKLTGEGEDNLLNFEIEVIEYPAPKIKIVKIKANPKGKDTLGEEIYLKNNSKKKVNLKTWSIATGDKNLYNHPITKDFVIQPGKTKKITRKYSLFTLNNKKGAIELRYPNGEVTSRVKYDKKKETVKDDEVYELSGKKWQWNAPAEEIPSGEVNLPEGSFTPEENLENINPETELEISDEEITLNLGKYSSENKIVLAEIKFKSAGENLLQSRETPGIVLGAFSARGENHKPIEIKSVNHWQKTLQKSNQLFNLLINQFIRLI